MTHNKLNYLEKFHQSGHRMTRQRQAILDALCQADGHTTTSDIYYRAKALDDTIDRSTIYRSLEVFVKLGLVICGDSINGDRMYELVKDHQHHHLICTKCGLDTEIEHCFVDDFYQDLRNEYHYAVEMDHIIVYGICESCTSVKLSGCEH